MAELPALVTGATGMVGSAIVRALLRRGRLVRVLARDPARARALFGETVEVAPGDLGTPETLRRACAGVGDVYHAAAALGFHLADEAQILETNVEGTRRLLAAARGAGATRLVYTSSVAVYGDLLPVGATEDAPLNPSGAYGASKARAERLLWEAGAAGFPCVAVRPCIVYGPGDRYFLPEATRVAALPVLPLPDGGDHLLDVVHADDVAAAHLLAAEAGRPGEAYNVTDGARYRVRDVMRWLADALGRSPRILRVSARCALAAMPVIRAAGRVGGIPALRRLRRQELLAFFGDYHFSIAKIAALGYTPRIHARDGLRAVLFWGHEQETPPRG